MTSIVAVDNNWLKGIAKYLSIGATIMATGNVPLAIAVPTIQAIFDAWKKNQKGTILIQKKDIEEKNGLISLPLSQILPSETTELIEELIDVIPPLTKKEKKQQKKEEKKKRKSKEDFIDPEAHLRKTLKALRNLL